VIKRPRAFATRSRPVAGDRRRIAAAVVALVVLGAAAVTLSVPTADDHGAAAAAGSSRWQALSSRMAAPWPALQHRNGELTDLTDRLPEPFGRHPGTRYGDAVMGYGLLMTGLREGDRRLVHTGLRAVSVASDPARRPHRPSVFENFAVAAAYNLARSRLAGNPEFERLRPRWAAWLRRVTIVNLRSAHRYHNHWLVDALAILELQRAGLHSSAPGSPIGGSAAVARRLASDLVNVRIPRLLPRSGAAVLSDAPDNPLAYHGLSMGLYARAVQLLGRAAAPAARRVLRQTVWASALMMAPDGSTAYFGRSQEEVWAPAGAAYGAAVTATLPDSSPAVRSVATTVAVRSLERLESAYPIGREGVAITPAVGPGLHPGWRGLDTYAAGPSMGGIALMMLDWTLEAPPPDRTSGRLPAAYPLAAAVSQENGRFAVLRKGRTWVAVKMTVAHNGRSRRDLRYDAGIAYAMRREGGRWRELVPERPRTLFSGRASAAPALLLPGRKAQFSGDAMSVSRRGAVRIRGMFGRDTFAPRPGSLLYRVIPCGVALGFGARAGDLYRMALFFTHRPRVTATTASDGHQTVRVSADRAALALSRTRYASGDRALLWRVDVAVRARTDQRVGVRYCA
jgi:hypothetical protein